VTLYRCVAMDPPWAEHGGGKCKRGADRHYPLMKLPEIVRVCSDVLRGKVADDAHLWCWYTDNYLPHTLQLVDQLGFRYIRTMQWIKAAPLPFRAEVGAAIPPQRAPFMLQPFGLGQYMRGEHEGCILAVRGNGRGLAQHRDVGSVVLAPKTKHSVKPQQAYDKIERVSPGPRLEMFARAPRDGWDIWGNEVTS